MIHPQVIEKLKQPYEVTLPRSTDRILKMSETQVSHRHDYEMKTLSAYERETKRGQNQVTFIVIVALLCATIVSILSLVMFI